jgi:hypothetical protein
MVGWRETTQTAPFCRPVRSAGGKSDPLAATSRRKVTFFEKNCILIDCDRTRTPIKKSPRQTAGRLAPGHPIIGGQASCKHELRVASALAVASFLICSNQA